MKGMVPSMYQEELSKKCVAEHTDCKSKNLDKAIQHSNVNKSIKNSQVNMNKKEIIFKSSVNPNVKVTLLFEPTENAEIAEQAQNDMKSILKNIFIEKIKSSLQKEFLALESTKFETEEQ